MRSINKIVFSLLVCRRCVDGYTVMEGVCRKECVYEGENYDDRNKDIINNMRNTNTTTNNSKNEISPLLPNSILCQKSC